ncbi:hypothetical protein [Streptomyces sp. NA02950]|nr:hypothetical protein [Streptomyces sp. NA02950]
MHTFRVTPPMPEYVMGTHHYPSLNGVLAAHGSLETSYQDSEVT